MTIGEEIFNEVRKAESDAIENDQQYGDYETVFALRDALRKHGYGLQMNMRYGSLCFCARDRDGHELTFGNNLAMTLIMIRDWSPFKKEAVPVQDDENLKDLLHGMSSDDRILLNRILQRLAEENEHE